MRQQNAKANDTLGKRSYIEKRLNKLPQGNRLHKTPQDKKFPESQAKNSKKSQKRKMRDKRITREPLKLADSQEHKEGKEEKDEDSSDELVRTGEGDYAGYPSSRYYLFQVYAEGRGLVDPPPMLHGDSLPDQFLPHSSPPVVARGIQGPFELNLEGRGPTTRAIEWFVKKHRRLLARDNPEFIKSMAARGFCMRRGERRIYANVHIPVELATFNPAYRILTAPLLNHQADISAVFIIGVHENNPRHGAGTDLYTHHTLTHTDPALTGIYGKLYGGRDADDYKDAGSEDYPQGPCRKTFFINTPKANGWPYGGDPREPTATRPADSITMAAEYQLVMEPGDWYSMGAINWHRVVTTQPCALIQGLSLATPIPPLVLYLSTLGPGKHFGAAPGEPTATAGHYGVHRGAREINPLTKLTAATVIARCTPLTSPHR